MTDIEKQLKSRTVDDMVAVIVNDVKRYLRDEREIRALEPVGSLERASNLQQVVQSVSHCKDVLHKCPEPDITIGDADALGRKLVRITGPHGEVAISVGNGESLTAQYLKKQAPNSVIAGEAIVDTPRVWSRLARWACLGEKKFTDRCVCH